MRRLARSAVAFGLAGAAAGCVPKLTPLSGSEVPASRLPNTQLPPGHRRIIFKWDLQDGEMNARGDGAARIAAPDSARLDFFLGGGFGQGAESRGREGVEMRDDLSFEIGHRETHIGAADIGDQGRGIAQTELFHHARWKRGGNLAASAALSKRKRVAENRFD